jgi:lipopolysaccharide heptosyltransferase II
VRVLRLLLRRPAGRDLLLIKFWGLGSLQLLTPAVSTLRRRHPEARIALLTLVENERFANRLGAFDEVLTLDVAQASWRRVFLRILALVRTLRGREFQAVYDFEFFTRFSAVVSWLSGAPRSYGFAAPRIWRGRLHSGTVPFNRYWHVARNFRCLAGGENGWEVSWTDLSAPRVTEEDARELDAVLGELALDRSRPLCVLNPNAGLLSLERRWPQAGFAAVAQRTIDETERTVVLIGSPSEVAWTSEVAALIGRQPEGRFANLAGRLSLGGLQALLERAEIFLTNDTGPMHLAAAVGTPTVGLFGPETPVMYAPLGPHVRALYAPPPCSPCINVHENKVSNCYRGKPECLINLTADHVFEEAQALVSRARLRLEDGAGEPLRRASPS